MCNLSGVNRLKITILSAIDIWMTYFYNYFLPSNLISISSEAGRNCNFYLI